jgi:hypothetical protein
MKRKTIKAVLKKQMNQWLNSIEDSDLVELLRKDIIVTGGCITSMLLGEDVKDFDIYLRSKEAVLALSKYYVDKFNKNNGTKALVVDCGNAEKNKEVFAVDGVCVAEKEKEENRVKIYIPSIGVLSENNNHLADPIEDCFDVIEENKEKEKYRPVFLSSNAITLSDKIQIIIRFYGEAEEIHKNYDFIHCTNYWLSENEQLYTTIESLESILSKTLFYQGSKYPLCSIIRTRKFINRGWKISAGEYLKMCFQVSRLDLTNIEVLEDQLIGVDSAYFGMLIDAIKEHKARHPEFMIDNCYVTTLIDKIFN